MSRPSGMIGRETSIFWWLLVESFRPAAIAISVLPVPAAPISETSLHAVVEQQLQRHRLVQVPRQMPNTGPHRRRTGDASRRCSHGNASARCGSGRSRPSGGRGFVEAQIGKFDIELLGLDLLGVEQLVDRAQVTTTSR